MTSSRLQLSPAGPAHAYPRTVYFVDALPKTPSAKIQRYVLRERRGAPR